MGAMVWALNALQRGCWASTIFAMSVSTPGIPDVANPESFHEITFRVYMLSKIYCVCFFMLLDKICLESIFFTQNVN